MIEDLLGGGGLGRIAFNLLSGSAHGSYVAQLYRMSTVPDLGDPGRQMGAASPEGLDLMLSVANLAYILATDRHMRLYGLGRAEWPDLRRFALMTFRDAK